MIDEPWSTDPNRVSFLAFTSGSTGKPKGVMHSDNTQLSTLRALVADWQLGTDTVVYSMSPLSHNLGVGALLTSFIAGGEFVVHDLSRGDSLLDRLIDCRANYLVGVPTHALDLLSEARQRGLSKIPDLKGFRVSGAASGPELLGSLLEFGIPVQSGYGMTETCSHQYTLPSDGFARITETCGRACHGYEVRIWSPDDPETEMPVGQIGQVGGRGASLTLGYFDDQIATESAFNGAGWFLTGDLGFLDADGYLHLTGRMKELIIRGGHNINPAAIEKLVLQFDAIEHAAVVGMPDPRLGERICLAVRFRPGRRVSQEQIFQHLHEAGLSRYEMPEFLAEMDDVPLMPNGKVRKREIEQAVREGTVPVQAIAPEGLSVPGGAARPSAN